MKEATRTWIFIAALSVGSTAGMAQTAQTLTANPSAVTFSYQSGAAIPAAQTVQIQSVPVGQNFTTAVSGSSFNAAWLLVSASSGKAPFSLKIQVNPTGLAAGSYAGLVTVTSTSGTTPPTATIAVTLLVSAAPPLISSSPASLNFTYVTGTPIPAPSLTNAFILSSSGAPLSATITVTGAPWLKIAPTGNISLIGLFNTIAVTVDPTGLAPKVYNAAIKISAPASSNKNLTVNVSLTVNSAPPTITGVWPGGVIQGSPANVVTVTGSNFFANSTVAATGFTGEATVTVTDGISTVSMPYLIPVYPATASQVRFAIASPLPTGTVSTGYTQPLSATGGTSPYLFSLHSGALPPGLAVSGAALAGTPSAAGTYTFTLRISDSASPAPGIAYQEFQLTVYPAAASALRLLNSAVPLPVGGVSNAYGPVTLSVAGGTGGPYNWSATGLPVGLTLSTTGVLSGTPTTEGAIGPLAATLVSDTAMFVTVPAPYEATPGTLRLAVTTPAPGGGTSNDGELRVYGPGPQITAVVNSASYRQGTIAPGDIINIFGLGVGPATLTLFDPSSPPIPTSLPAAAPSTSVTINGTAAPLLYTSAAQLGLIVPYTISGASAQIIVTYNGVPSVPFTSAVAASDPGIYTIASSGIGQGAILNYNAATQDYTINSASNPAAKGSTIVIYVTGAGQTTSSVYDLLVPASPAVTPVLSPLVQIGGQTAAVIAAQAPIGSVPGLIQMNVTVPTTITAGPVVPVIVSFGGVASPTGVTMAVR
ncbi:MAG: hypothetical protein ABI823_03815 [Bryobacteraceae bacterium]